MNISIKNIFLLFTFLMLPIVCFSDTLTELSHKWWDTKIQGIEEKIQIQKKCLDEIQRINEFGNVCVLAASKTELVTAKMDVGITEILIKLEEEDEKEIIDIQEKKEVYSESIKRYQELLNEITESVNSSSSWIVRTDTSEIDDSSSVYLHLESTDKISGAYSEHTPVLTIRCVENKTQAYINVGAYLGHNRVKVTTRLDKNKARTQRWSLSTNGKAVFVSGGDIKWIKELMKHENLTMRVAPYNEGDKTFSFNIAGLEDAIKPLREACHW